MRIGKATPEDTRTYAKKNNIDSFRTIGKTELTVSKIGFGSYRLHDAYDEHLDALKYALLNGCNYIDSSPNFMDGHSERLISKALKEAEDAGIYRKHYVLVSKAGFLQGENLKRVVEGGESFPDLVTFKADCYHCISADFLQDQLERSLDRLDCVYIDGFMIQNPEYYLLDAHHKSLSLEDARTIFYARLELAFEQCERFVLDEKIQYYGMTSNSLAIPKEMSDYISFEETLRCAERACKRVNGHINHHFSAIEIPLNLYEQSARTETFENGKTLLDLAAEANISVIAHRPMNAMNGQEFERLAMYPYDETLDYSSQMAQYLTVIESLEADLKQSFKEDGISLEFEDGLHLDAYLNIKQPLSELLTTVTITADMEAIRVSLLDRMFAKVVDGTFAYIPQDKKDIYLKKFQLFYKTMQQFFVLLQGSVYKTHSEKQSALHQHLLEQTSYHIGTALNQMVTNAVASTKGVTTVLCGMRKKPYVEELLYVLNFSDEWSLDKLKPE